MAPSLPVRRRPRGSRPDELPRHRSLLARAAPRLPDAVLLAALVYLEVSARAAASAGSSRYGLPDPRWLGLVLLAGQLGPVAWRRRFPLAAHLVVLACWLSYAWLDRVDTVALLVPMVTLYSVAAHRRLRAAVPALSVTVLAPALVLAAATAAGRPTEQPLAGDIAGFGVAFAVGWLLGVGVRWRRKARRARAAGGDPVTVLDTAGTWSGGSAVTAPPPGSGRTTVR